MSQLGGGPVKTFTLDFQQETFSEAEGARLVARHFDTDHREFLVHPDVAELLPKLIWHLDEPLGDSSLIPTYLVASLARQEVTVALSGIGGDELFYGYPRYIGAKLARQYERLPLALRNRVARLAHFIPDSVRSDNPLGRLRRFLLGGRLPAHLRYLAWMSFFTPDALAELFAQPIESIDPYSQHLAYLDGSARDPYFYLDLRTYLPEDLLMLGDKMTMAASLELRVPFCDHRLVEFMAHVAPELRAPGFKLKALLKEVMAPWLPQGILDRPKRGFTLPLASWFKGPLRGLVLDLLSEERLKRRGYLNPLPIQQLLTEHLSGTRSYFDQIFSLLVFELWHQAYLDEWAGRQAAILREVA
jgi:asparagine synthase (glutamine-hydrolysing)